MSKSNAGISQAEIVVTGIGMRTSLGNTAVQTCAAVRASISRLREWPYFGTSDGEEGGLVAAATLPDLGDGHWTEKAIELIAQPIFESLWQAKLYELSSELNRSRFRIGVFLATPYQDRGGVDVGDDGYATFIDEFQQFLTEQMQVGEVKVYPAGHAAGLIAISQACQEIANQQIDLAVVCGVDSLLDATYLEELFDQDLLKSELESSGIVPGEAGVALVLESVAHAERRQVVPMAAIRSLAMGMQAADSGTPAATGEALSECIQTVLKTHAPDGSPTISRVIVDLNGQRSRFLEWATVETRCMHALPRGWRIQHPADCFGDTGAAFGTLAIALAANGYSRGYPPVDGTLICCSSARGERAAAAIFPVMT